LQGSEFDYTKVVAPVVADLDCRQVAALVAPELDCRQVAAFVAAGLVDMDIVSLGIAAGVAYKDCARTACVEGAC
jgi:hypothetical protein